MKYKNIIFDLGGVLLNIDYSRTINAFKELGIPDFEQRYSQREQEGLFDLLETGKISAAEFAEGINNFSPKKIPAQEVFNAWNAMLLDFPQENLELLSKLKKSHKIFLLSNTNEIHIEAFNRIIYEQHGIGDFSHYFNKVYYSHNIGLRKPEPDVFYHIINEQNLDPAVTLFIDDSEQHVKGALETGINAKLLPKKMQLNQLLKPLIFQS